MGHESSQIDRAVTPTLSPQIDEIELSLFGPGYGECVLIHIGNDRWVVVDSCLDTDYRPAALTYLRSLGLDPSTAVCLIVATHWHDDHIRGLGQLVEICDNAIFCCASVLTTREFLAAVGALENRPATDFGSGVRELYRVFSLLEQRSATWRHAISDRIIFNRDNCRIRSLSPSDRAFRAFLQAIGRLVPQEMEPKRRVPPLTPNEAAVVLLIELDQTVVLLGADLENEGWLEILDIDKLSDTKASVFKLPHHGSQNAHENRVWNDMLREDPIAVVTPWRRGGRALPTKTDALRILSLTDEAYVTGSQESIVGRLLQGRSSVVERTIRESGARIRTVGLSDGMIRLRKKITSVTDWNVELFGSACQLADYNRPT